MTGDDVSRSAMHDDGHDRQDDGPTCELDDHTAEQVLRGLTSSEHAALLEVLTAWRDQVQPGAPVAVGDELATWLRDGCVPARATPSEHREAMINGSPPVDDNVIAITDAPSRRGRARRVVVRLAAASAATTILSSGLAAAGALPSPVQRVVSRAVRVVGIDLPRPERPVLAPAPTSTSRADAPSTTAPPPEAPFVAPRPPATPIVGATAEIMTTQTTTDTTSPDGTASATTVAPTTSTTKERPDDSRRDDTGGAAGQRVTRRDGCESKRPHAEERPRAKRQSCRVCAKAGGRRWLSPRPGHARRSVARRDCESRAASTERRGAPSSATTTTTTTSAPKP